MLKFFRRRERTDDTHRRLTLLELRVAAMENDMAVLDDLRAQVTKNNTVIGSALALINGFKDQLARAGSDAAILQGLQQELDAQDVALAAAVAANTSAAPETTTATPLATDPSQQSSGGGTAT